MPRNSSLSSSRPSQEPDRADGTRGDSVASLEEQNVPVDPNTSIHSSILNLLGKPDVLVPSTNTNSRHAVGAELKPNIIAGIQEIMDELKKIYDDISAHALDHIHSSEIILTHGSSQTVSSFLVTAAEKRKFTVIVTEAYPNDIDASHAMADKLAKAGINVILVPDSAVFGLMSRVNKVIMSTHAVLANGGLLASAGAQMVAQAARVHATPVVVVTGVYKVSPVYPYDVESLIELADPGKVLSFSEGDLIDGVDVCNPYYDYVSPDMVDLYITNLGGHPPTFLNRIVAEQYDAQDTVL